MLMPIGCENDWLFYKELVSGSQVGCAEVVVDVDTRSMYVPSQGGDEYPIDRKGYKRKSRRTSGGRKKHKG